MNKEISKKGLKDLSLRKLVVLAIDCQATHSNPDAGQLAEIGWTKTQAARFFDHELTTEKVRSHLLKIEDNSQVPKQFYRITGIGIEEMKEAVSKRTAWQNLHRAAKQAASCNRGICAAVIHFSRYEEPYLRQLHQEFTPKHKFPFTIFCTHKIVSRLYPGLPRKGLRAAAGFFGYALPNQRRSLHHVVATAFIWNHLVGILEEREKITTFGELKEWLLSPPADLSRQYPREYPMGRAFRQDLPDRPGIYRMYRSSGDLLYIGKAKSIKHRVNSYFTKRGRHSEHILEMLSQAQGLSATVTPTAFEAAIRESDEIKLLSPPYNRALQSNERQLLFYTKDLGDSRSEPSKQHPIGPIPSKVKLGSLAMLIDVLNSKIKRFTPRLIGGLLDTPPEHTPEKACFVSGLDIFKHEHCIPNEASLTLSNGARWGSIFWQEKLAEKESESAIEEEEESKREDDKEEVEEGWTPERVYKALKRKIRIDCFQMRRARWFCRLSESSLAWTNTNGADREMNVLVFENGKANPKTSSSLTESPSNSLIIPPGHNKSLLQRQANFDIATYDRMRIVTTEMRRILQEGRNIELKFHPGDSLSNNQLEKILKWV